MYLSIQTKLVRVHTTYVAVAKGREERKRICYVCRDYTLRGYSRNNIRITVIIYDLLNMIQLLIHANKITFRDLNVIDFGRNLGIQFATVRVLPVFSYFLSILITMTFFYFIL